MQRARTVWLPEHERRPLPMLPTEQPVVELTRRVMNSETDSAPKVRLANRRSVRHRFPEGAGQQAV